MQSHRLHERINFTVQLLNQLKDVYEQTTKIVSYINESTADFYESFFTESKKTIEHEVNLYKANIEKMKQINIEITEKINTWYTFAKNPKELEKFLFPIRFFIRQKQIRKEIIQLNQQISNLLIENRFLKEKLLNWEHELKQKAVKSIQQTDHYKKYTQLVEKAQILITDLQYLIPTLPITKSAVLDLDEIDKFIHMLQKI